MPRPLRSREECSFLMKTTRSHCPICDAELEMPADVLDGMAEAPRLYAEALRSAFPRPREGWSPGEIIVHMADTEVAWGWRIRLMLAADDPQLQPYDQDAFAERLRYAERDPNVALASFAALRADHIDLLRPLPERAWERVAGHPEFGSLSLRTLVQHLAHHDIDHLRQIREG